jgi:hypothetical protein
MNYTETLCIVSHMVEEENRLLMSDELRGMVPELDEQTKSYEDSLVIASLVLTRAEDHHVTGKVVGLSLENGKEVKVDIRVDISTAFHVMKEVSTDVMTCKFCALILGGIEHFLDAPYAVSSSRMVDFDHHVKMCTLGLDLIKA